MEADGSFRILVPVYQNTLTHSRTHYISWKLLWELKIFKKVKVLSKESMHCFQFWKPNLLWCLFSKITCLNSNIIILVLLLQNYVWSEIVNPYILLNIHYNLQIFENLCWVHFLVQLAFFLLSIPLSSITFLCSKVSSHPLLLREIKSLSFIETRLCFTTYSIEPQHHISLNFNE